MEIKIDLTEAEILKIEDDCNKEVKGVKTMGEMFGMILEVFRENGIDFRVVESKPKVQGNKGEGMVKPQI